MHLPEEKNFTPCPSGAHLAVCIGFIDLGTQDTNFGSKHQVRIRWELPTELMEDGRPFTISNTYTWSMSDKARLRGDLESWRGRAFEKGDFGKGGFDTRKLLGVPCLLTVIHKTSGLNVYANISSISPIPKGMEKPGAAKNPLVYFALTKEEFDKSIYAGFPDKLREAIASSPEYQEIVNGVVHDPNEANFDRHDMDDEIPF